MLIDHDECRISLFCCDSFWPNPAGDLSMDIKRCRSSPNGGTATSGVPPRIRFSQVSEVSSLVNFLNDEKGGSQTSEVSFFMKKVSDSTIPLSWTSGWKPGVAWFKMSPQHCSSRWRSLCLVGDCFRESLPRGVPKPTECRLNSGPRADCFCLFWFDFCFELVLAVKMWGPGLLWARCPQDGGKNSPKGASRKSKNMKVTRSQTALDCLVRLVERSFDSWSPWRRHSNVLWSTSFGRLRQPSHCFASCEHAFMLPGSSRMLFLLLPASAWWRNPGLRHGCCQNFLSQKTKQVIQNKYLDCYIEPDISTEIWDSINKKVACYNHSWMCHAGEYGWWAQRWNPNWRPAHFNGQSTCWRHVVGIWAHLWARMQVFECFNET